MKTKKELLKPIGGLILHSSINCLLAAATSGAAPLLQGAGAIVATVVGGITSNLAANHTAVLGNLTYDKLIRRLGKQNPNDINHDLERLFRESAVVSLEFIKTLFLAEVEHDERLGSLSKTEKDAYIDGLKGFFDENIEDLRIVTQDNTDILDKSLLVKPEKYLDEIVAQIFRLSTFTLDETTVQKLKKFYAAKLPYCFELAFKEALKKDDAGFKAFQIWILEEMREHNIEILKGQKRIEELISEIKAGQNIISLNDIDALLNAQVEKIYALLSQDFRDIKIQFTRLSFQIQEQFDALYRIGESNLAIGMAGYTVGKATYEEVKGLRNDFNESRKTPQFPHHLINPLPPTPEVFFGRDDEPGEIRKKLFEDNNMLLLVNGQGGIGKTSLAATYYHQYHEQYTHAAWVLCEQSIGNALLLLAPALKLEFGQNEEVETRVQKVLAAMAELDKPCLLVIDNANEIEDMEAWYLHLRGCSNFHLLLTTRITKFQNAEPYVVKPLSKEAALKLFKRYYPKHTSEEDVLFEQIWLAADKNTLVIELLAKSLEQVNEDEMRYSLSAMLNALQQKGLLALETAVVDTGYQGKGKLRHEKPEAIIEAMYDLAGLTQAEIDLLSMFAVLPAENIAYDFLKTLSVEENANKVPDALKLLYRKGWLSKGEIDKAAYYKISPVIQEITRKKNEKILESVDPLLRKLGDLLEYEPGTGHLLNIDFQSAVLMVRYAETLLHTIGYVNFDLCVLAERVGSYHTTIGNLPKALVYYELYRQYGQLLHGSYPEDISYKRSLAISYSKLGETHASLGNIPKALQYYEDETRLFEELHESYPEQVNFKNGLAISYEKLGETHASLGNLPKALQYYDDETRLFEELHESYPENISYKYSLAISYEKLGSTHATLGNLPKALQYYDDETRLFEELHASYPEQVNFKNGLAISYSKLGSTHASLGNLPKALEYYEQYHLLRRELYASYPEQVRFKNGLAISYSKLGETYASFGNLPKALEYYEQYHLLHRELYASYPENVSYKNGLAVSYSKLGETHASLGNLPKALWYYEQYHVLCQELHEGYPEQVNFKNGLAVSYSKLGETHASLGNLPKALVYYEQYHLLRRELYASYPEHVSFKNGLAISYEQLGKTHTKLGNLPKALQYYNDETRLFEELHASYPEQVNFKYGLAISYEKLGETHARLGNLPKALEYYELDIRLSQELHASYPEQVSFKNGLALSYATLGMFYRDTDKERARGYFEPAKQLWQELNDSFPDYAEFKKNLGWVKLQLEDL